MSLSQQDVTKQRITEFEQKLLLNKIERNTILGHLQELKIEIYGSNPPDDVNRRNCVWLRTPEETMVVDLIKYIEGMASDVRLTNAQTKLQEAFDLLADYNDSIKPFGEVNRITNMEQETLQEQQNQNVSSETSESEPFTKAYHAMVSWYAVKKQMDEKELWARLNADDAERARMAIAFLNNVFY